MLQGCSLSTCISLVVLSLKVETSVVELFNEFRCLSFAILTREVNIQPTASEWATCNTVGGSGEGNGRA